MNGLKRFLFACHPQTPMIGVFRGSRQMDDSFTAKCLTMNVSGFWNIRASSNELAFFFKKMALSGD